MHIYQRYLENEIKKRLFEGKVICLFGPRRSGKTTLAKKILSEYGNEGYYLNCEDARERSYLIPGNPDILKNYISGKKIIVLDEAQTVENIGIVLKVFVDTYPEIQLIATGSSSFELANRVGEPLVGRAWDFFLPPLAFEELFVNKGGLEVNRELPSFLVYGSYPQVVNSLSKEEKILSLGQIANNYLYKDIFVYEQIRKLKILEDLLKTIAFQISKEVSITELSKHLNTARPTIERYLWLLEKTFVIKRIYSLKRNRRDEIRSNFKIYFYDLGVRNYIINSLNELENRNDIGELFENYFVMERIKYHYHHHMFLPLMYFWRTHSQLEVDYIEEKDSNFEAFECKWKNKIVSFTEFKKSYPNSNTYVVHKDNIQDFLR
jgi:hypothetical protein